MELTIDSNMDAQKHAEYMKSLHLCLSSRENFIDDLSYKIHKAKRIFNSYSPERCVNDPQGMYKSITEFTNYMDAYTQRGRQQCAELHEIADLGLKFYCNTSISMGNQIVNGIFIPIPYLQELEKMESSTQTMPLEYPDSISEKRQSLQAENLENLYKDKGVLVDAPAENLGKLSNGKGVQVNAPVVNTTERPVLLIFSELYEQLVEAESQKLGKSFSCMFPTLQDQITQAEASVEKIVKSCIFPFLKDQIMQAEADTKSKSCIFQTLPDQMDQASVPIVKPESIISSQRQELCDSDSESTSAIESDFFASVPSVSVKSVKSLFAWSDILNTPSPRDVLSHNSFKSLPIDASDSGNGDTQFDLGVSSTSQSVCNKAINNNKSSISAQMLEEGNAEVPVKICNSLDLFQVYISKSMERIKSSFSLENLIDNEDHPVKKMSSIEGLRIQESRKHCSEVGIGTDSEQIQVGARRCVSSGHIFGNNVGEEFITSTIRNSYAIIPQHERKASHTAISAGSKIFAPESPKSWESVGAKKSESKIRYCHFDSNLNTSTPSLLLQDAVDDIKFQLLSPSSSRASIPNSSPRGKLRSAASMLFGDSHSSRTSFTDEDFYVPGNPCFPQSELDVQPMIATNDDNDIKELPISEPKCKNNFKSSTQASLKPKVKKEVKFSVASHIVPRRAPIPAFSKNSLFPYIVKKRSKSVNIPTSFPVRMSFRQPQSVSLSGTPRSTPRRLSPVTPRSPERQLQTNPITGWIDASAQRSIGRFETEYRAAYKIDNSNKDNENWTLHGRKRP